MCFTNRISKFNVSVIVFCLIVVFGFGRARAAGALDLTFGTGGKVVTPIGSGASDEAQDIAIQPDGKIVVVGSTSPIGPVSNILVIRYNPNGTLDTTFDGDGKVITAIGTKRDYGQSVVIQPDGKIVVAGATEGAIHYDFAIVRYNANGSLDTTFDGDGKVVTSISDRSDFAYEVALQADGKIVAAGDAENAPSVNDMFALARYNADGSLDSTFDGDGKLTTFFRDTPRSDSAYGLLIQPDGKIVAAGQSYSGFNVDYDFALARYNPNGSLDTTFDTDGKVTTPVSTTTSPDGTYDIALQPDGKIVAVGSAYASPNNDDSVVVRYNANGSLDTTFDTDGKVYFSFGTLTEGLAAVGIQADGKIVAAGSRNNGSSPAGATGDVVVARLNANGSLDTTFDGDGKVATPVLNGYAGAFAVAIQPNGKIVAAGYASPVDSGDSEVMLVRYMGDLNTADFDGDTKTDISIFRPSSGDWWIQNSRNNSVAALTFGAGTDKIVPGDYTGDGRTDVAVWRPSTGEWLILRSEDGTYFAHPFGANGDVPVPADFDGDGKSDEVVFRPDSATWYINKTSGGIVIQQFGAAGDVPLPSDYDGDGKADFAVFRPNGTPEGQWWIQKSSNSQVFATAFGTSSDTPVPADFTGDGKTDIAFWRPNTGFWFVLRSEDFSFFSFPFGANGDTPAPGDYDGDGTADAAVFRPSNATWFVRNSTLGVLTQQFGASGDKPVPSAFIP
jgi:uncharacterized delta-60 repeat protein